MLGILWIYTEIFYNGKRVERDKGTPPPKGAVAHRHALHPLLPGNPLMAVSVLEHSGILAATAAWLDEKIHNIYIINILLGVMSSVFDNVPLVAGVMGMYPVTDPGATAGYMANFVQDGIFWGVPQLLCRRRRAVCS